MNFSEQPRSTQWTAFKYMGENVVGVWFKPEGEPNSLVIRIPLPLFHLPRLAQQLTVANLLYAVGLAAEEVDSWHHGSVSHAGMNGANPELGIPLPPPPPGVPCLDIYVCLKPLEVVVAKGSNEPEVPLKNWQELESVWKGILGLELTIDQLRVQVEGTQVEMELSLTKTMSPEEKAHALRRNVAQWNKAKSRVRFELPKMKEFIHRAVWAMGSPERKRLDEIYKVHIQPHIPFPHMNELLRLLEGMQKDRQILAGQGLTVSQESKYILAEVQGTLRVLQSNAAANAVKKKGANSAKKNKFFKQARKWSGAD